MRGREAPRVAGLAKPRVGANHPARFAKRAPPFAIREVRLSALHCGTLLHVQVRACVSPALTICRKTVQRSSSRTGLSARRSESQGPGHPAWRGRIRGHRILLHLPTPTGRRPLSEQNGSRIRPPALKSCEGAVQKTKKSQVQEAVSQRDGRSRPRDAQSRPGSTDRESPKPGRAQNVGT
jgi:hypothetical protein